MRAFIALSFFTMVGFVSYGQRATPRITSTDTPSGKKGDVVSFTGENLQNAIVAGLYLTDGENDFKVVFMEQTSRTVRFKIPEGVPSGRFAFMVLTTGKSMPQTFIALPRFKMTIDQRGNFQIDDTDKRKAEEEAKAAEERRKACGVIYQNTADKKIRDLTVKEEQGVRTCQALGLYPPR